MTSFRLTEEGEAALLLLQALLPRRTKIDLISDALQIAAKMVAVPRVIRFSTLDGAELVRVQGANAKLELLLGRFRKDLIAIEKKSDSFEEFAQLVTKAEKALTATVELRNRLGKLAMVTETLNAKNLSDLFAMKLTLKDWIKSSDDDSRPVYELMLKLFTPFLP